MKLINVPVIGMHLKGVICALVDTDVDLGHLSTVDLDFEDSGLGCEDSGLGH